VSLKELRDVGCGPMIDQREVLCAISPSLTLRKLETSKDGHLSRWEQMEAALLGRGAVTA
jgi:hypothetical protein